MPRYFTREDRRHTIILFAAMGTIEKIIAEMEKTERPKEWLTPLRHTKAWLKRATDAIAYSCDDPTWKRIIKENLNHEIVVLPKHEATKIKTDTVEIENDALMSLAEAVLMSQCCGCTRKDYEDCKYRHALMNALIPPWEDPVPEGKCQYKYEVIGEGFG